MKRVLPVVVLAAIFATPFMAKAQSEQAAPNRDRLDSKLLYQILLGDIAAQRGEYRLAARAYLEAARSTRDLRLARRAAEIAAAANQATIGLQATQLWAELDAEAIRPKQLAAILLLSEGRFAEAEQQLQTVFSSLDATKVAAEFLQLARLLSNQDKQAGFRLVKNLAQLHPSLAEAHFAVAQAALGTELKEIVIAEAAIKAIDQALALKPSWEPALLLKAQLLAKTAPSLATDFLREQVKSSPDARQLRLSLAQQLLQQKRYEEARSELVSLADQWSDPKEMWQAVAQISISMRDYAFAEEVYQRLLRTEDVDVDAIQFTLAQLSEERKRYAEALERYRAVRDGEQWWPAQIRIALVLAKLESLEAALAHLRRLAATTDAQKIHRLQTHAQLLRDVDQHTGAYELLSDGLKIHPDSAELLYDYAMVAEKLDKLDVLETQLKRLIELKPDSAHAYNALGYTLVDRTERVEEGLRYIEKAHALAPEDPFIEDSLGWAHYRRGNNELAIKYLKSALQKRADPEIAAHLGEVLWVTGAREEARKIWKEQLIEAPNHRVLRETIKRLDP